MNLLRNDQRQFLKRVGDRLMLKKQSIAVDGDVEEGNSPFSNHKLRIEWTLNASTLIGVLLIMASGLLAFVSWVDEYKAHTAAQLAQTAAQIAIINARLDHQDAVNKAQDERTREIYSDLVDRINRVDDGVKEVLRRLSQPGR